MAAPAGSSPGKGEGDYLGLSRLADRLPKVKSSGCTDVESYDRGMERQHVVTLLKLISKNPEMASKCVDHVHTRLAEAEKSNVDLSTTFREVSTLGKLDEQWMSAYIVANTLLTSADVIKMKIHDSDVVKHLMAQKLHSTLTAQVPEECAEKVVAKRTFDDRAKIVGPRLQDLQMDGSQVTAEGAVSWPLVGPYKFGWSEEPVPKLTAVTHKPTDCAVQVDPAEYVITQNFDLIGGWSDLKSRLECGARKYTLSDFFGKDQGPHKIAQLKGKAQPLKELAAAVQSDIMREQQKAREGTLVEDTGAAIVAWQERKKQSAERARTALARAQEVRQKKRRISLKSTTVAAASAVEEVLVAPEDGAPGWCGE